MDLVGRVWLRVSRKRLSQSMWRWLTAAVLACSVWLGLGTTAAVAQGTGYSVTFAARQCKS
ncbi:MAG TPA: hypothetical protein VIY10_20160 [Solirubrobacteraceae bacterium]